MYFKKKCEWGRHRVDKTEKTAFQEKRRLYQMAYGISVPSAAKWFSAKNYYGTACVGAPDTGALENGRKLGGRVAELVKRLT